MHGPGFGNVEHLQHHKALGYRRLLVDDSVAISRAQRFEPLADDALEIFLGENAALGLYRRADLGGDFAGIKTVAPFERDFFQHGTQAFLDDDLPRLRRAERLAIKPIHPWKVLADLVDPLGKLLRDRKALARDANRIRRQPAQFLSGVFPVQLQPTVDRTWYRDTQRAELRYRFEPVGVKIVDGRFGRRRAAGVERFDRAGFFHRDQCE